MGKTSIQWTDMSINPIRARNADTGAVGHYCEKISPGCANCYSSRMQGRFAMPPFPGRRKLTPLPVVRDDGCVPLANGLEVFLDDGKLKEIIRRKKPTKFFWCDMTDMFGEWVPDEWVDRCFAAMALSPQHVHQVLTKRTARMASYIARTGRSIQYLEAGARHLGYTLQFEMPDTGKKVGLVRWPLPGVWLGTSMENQAMADERIPHLFRCPAAVRFLSCEPLLGPISIPHAARWHFADCACLDCCERRSRGEEQPGIDWVIVGGESGPGARPMDVAWARSIVGQCKAAGTAVFVKQLGAKPVWDGCGLVANNPRCPTTKEGINGREMRLLRPKDGKGGDPEEWPADLRVREFPGAASVPAEPRQ